MLKVRQKIPVIIASPDYYYLQAPTISFLNRFFNPSHKPHLQPLILDDYVRNLSLRILVYVDYNIGALHTSMRLSKTPVLSVSF